ncbi:MAG: hypothetical protein Q4F15_00240 [Bacillota bacterium]|nr:hypothetical protein [Bacillota bacterium]
MKSCSMRNYYSKRNPTRNCSKNWRMHCYYCLRKNSKKNCYPAGKNWRNSMIGYPTSWRSWPKTNCGNCCLRSCWTTNLMSLN